MERNWNGSTNRAFGLVCVLMALFWIGRHAHNKTRRTLPTQQANNNPNGFIAWSTNSSVRYTFTYDPHAADVWRFESGGQPVAATNNSSLPKPKWTWKN
jgi:hypothetical protein